MIQSRIIPCLLLHNGGLVKTVQFKNPTYVGDPINAVKIFNEKEVDELILIDIDATVEQREPKYKDIEDIVSEAFMPVCYGGGVKTVEQMHRLFALGIEKVSVSSAALETPALVEQASRQFGSQSIIVTIDVKKTRFSKTYRVVTHNGNNITRFVPLEIAQRMEAIGAGELLINNADYDGVMMGYDEELIKQISAAVKIPVIALGGTGSLHHLRNIVNTGGASAASAGSLFIFHGKHKAVLISYPTQLELKRLFNENRLQD
jgi:imidazole glycerol-phosphate synthase subunit HisF